MITPPRPGGIQADLAGRLHHLATSVVELLYGRVALLQWELAQERARLGSLLGRALLAASFLLLSVQLLAILLVALAWGTPWRLHVIVGLLGAAVLATAALAWRYRLKRLEDSPLLSGTLHELAKDRQALGTLK